MAVDEALVARIREYLVDHSNGRGVEEKRMFGGLCFMVDDKMCVCVRGDRMMCRVGSEDEEDVLERHGVRPMVHGGRAMKGFVYVDAIGHERTKDFRFWMDRCLQYNKVAPRHP